MYPLKVPGPNGFPSIFFQKCWNIVGPDVSSLVLEVLESNKDSNMINNTHIAFIPKCKNPSIEKDFCPMSLCNMVMKVIAKTIANRIKHILPDIVDEEKSVFVKGKLIMGNVLAAMKCFHWMKNKTKGKRGVMALKFWSMDSLVVRKAPTITHLFFVDDSLLFTRANKYEVDCVMDILQKYRVSSVQVVTLDKKRVFKSKYYTRSTIEESSSGFAPSYTWMSIRARELIQKGAYWRIGNGKKFQIFKDMRLSENSGFKILCAWKRGKLLAFLFRLDEPKIL
ncbi:unnamed protein product [Vicia faba]|uniref:Reverse transcriptase domain-containing protein n=1 Tax=Vicia faba TaxID=3906 RepID=A0AAV0ZCX7_VICFA|nr:unnamed protein product [Vicia faba]